MPFHSVTSPRVATSKPFGTYTMKIIMFFFLEFFGFSPLGHFVAGNFRCLLTSSVSFLFRGWNLPGDPCSSTIHHSAHRFFPSVVATAITSSAHFDNGAHGTAKHQIWYLWTPEQHGLLMRDQAWQLTYHRNPDTIWKNAVKDSSETPTSFDCSGGPAKHNLALQATHHGEGCCSQDTEEAWKSCVGSACQFGTVPNPDQNIGSKCTTLKLGSNGAGPKPKERPRRSHVRILGKRMINIDTLQCHQTWQLFKCPKLNMTNRGIFVGTSMLDKLQKFFFPKSEPLLVQIAPWQVLDHCHLLDRWCQINVII